MFRDEVLGAAGYLSLFDQTNESAQTQALLAHYATDDGAAPVALYHPQAVLLSKIDADAVKSSLSFMGRLAWDKDWNRDPDRFIDLILGMGHESVVEHVSLSFLVLCDRATSHEIVRHRIGTSFTQQSQRYVGFEDSSKPVPIVLPYGLTEDQEFYFTDMAITAVSHYRLGVNMMKIPKEQARLNLPNMTGTIIGITFNPRSLRHFLSLRMAKGAYPQIRAVANDIYDAMVASGLDILVKDFEPLKAFDPRQRLAS